MKISEFVETQHTTIDTVKHYIKLQLLTPKKENNWYNFTEKEISDFQTIKELQSLGLSLTLIKQIKETHDKYCGTLQQWESNLEVIEKELNRVQKEKEQLENQEKVLTEVQQQLKEQIEKKQEK